MLVALLNITLEWFFLLFFFYTFKQIHTQHINHTYKLNLNAYYHLINKILNNLSKKILQNCTNQ